MSDPADAEKVEICDHILDVPFVKQFHPNACGAAALEMVYRFLGRKTAKQEKIFRKWSETEPHGSGSLRIGVAGMVEDALNRNFYACARKFDVSSANALYRAMGWFVVQERLPIIACQQLSPEEPLIGHYRVVVALGPNYVIFHDPSSLGGGDIWPIQKFVNHWQGSGKNVVSGGAIIVARSHHPNLPSIEDVRREIAEYKAKTNAGDQIWGERCE